MLGCFLLLRVSFCPADSRAAQVGTSARPETPSERISQQDLAIIYRRAQSALTALRQYKSRNSTSIESELRLLVEGWLSEAADIPGKDTKLLTEDEKKLAQAMTGDVIAGKPAPVLKEPDSRLTEGVLRILLEETRSQSEPKTADGSPSSTESVRKQRIEFAQRRARELSKINDSLRPDELAEIENVVDLSLIPESFKVPTGAQPAEPRKPGNTAPPTTAALREQIFYWLNEICTKVFPLIGGLDANSRKLNLVKFIKDNQATLGVAEIAAEQLVEQFLAENPGAIHPPVITTTTTVTTPAVITVVQPLTTGVPYVVVPGLPTRRCLFRW
jgi:hypothetical protein